jgi:FMN phosphatase YigB (HAD superfamily)
MIHDLMTHAIDLGLFDFKWYETQHKLRFASPKEAFEDYLKKSPYTDVSPSPNFDTISYYENNPDVYEMGISPLEHYINFGRHEGRACFSLRPLWQPKTDLNESGAEHIRNGKYAIVLHIFYADFVERFNNALMGVDFEFDLFITTNNNEVAEIAYSAFRKNPAINKIQLKLVGNHGRNFGPFLVEFGRELLNYDYFCHLHSKKSLYSGKEQVQWSSFLVEYLLSDKQVLSRALNILEKNEKYGIYYPTSFWNLPTWVNHWLKNKHQGVALLEREYSIINHDDFISYPVGGMFWARTKALKPILDKDWRYEDFPPEPLPTDGSSLHTLERILPSIAQSQGYEKFFYNPSTGQFTDDESYIFRPYFVGNLQRLKNTAAVKSVISFDIFDTLAKRNFYEPDYAKYQLPARLGLEISGAEFVAQRNQVELDLRIKKNFVGDVDLYEIYTELLNRLGLPHDPIEIADLEFEIDFEGLRPKDTMVDFLNSLAHAGKAIVIVSDTYYLEHHIRKLLRNIGVACEYDLFISSAWGLRKDNSTMWQMIEQWLLSNGGKNNFLHIGDNVCADCQNSGDYGLQSFHILNPMDKWDAMSFPKVRNILSLKNPKMVLKWGQLVGQIGTSPFI